MLTFVHDLSDNKKKLVYFCKKDSDFKVVPGIQFQDDQDVKMSKNKIEMIIEIYEIIRMISKMIIGILINEINYQLGVWFLDSITSKI